MEFREIDNIEEIVELWNRNLGVAYPMELKLFKQNYYSDPQKKKIIGALDDEKLVGFVIYKQWTHKSGELEANTEIGYINSIIVDINYRNHGIGTKLMDMAEKKLIENGVKLIRLGSDTYHFFPGVPLECLTSENFFSSRNFEINESFYDLIGDISKLDLKRPLLKGNFQVGIMNHEDKEELFNFLKRSFSGRWYEEFMEFFNIGMEERDIVIVKNSDEVIGFAHIYDNKSNFIGPSIYWSSLLSENYGGLGPIGIDKAYRNRGLGMFLLYKSLEILKKRKVEKMVIDWTERDIINFYGKFNFMPWKEYKKAFKEVK
ncbi:GNAT family N-acetyltransferase [Clostridium felsineum]|uniref:Uncharacterized protein n=1 Tax=Clostridium felsineum TaxID=36839 RepID=A0A1S8L6S6_9CLOT|nr:GNAT family N-acetyltransferase [Clostridium felsineum]URZ09730.1 hypothetical protein CROST_004230 [Clostridium felsineum]